MVFRYHFRARHGRRVTVTASHLRAARKKALNVLTQRVRARGVEPPHPRSWGLELKAISA